MKTKQVVSLVAAILATCVAASCAHRAASKVTGAPSPTDPPALVLTDSKGHGVPANGQVAGPKGGAVTPSEPKRTRTDEFLTVAPWPVPGEDSAATARRKMANLPREGNNTLVKVLPDVIERYEPAYPLAARAAGVQGTVMVQALVEKDGHVADARILQSIAKLDDAALRAVRQWRFKPALSDDGPVAVWVAIPVKFTLH